MEFAAQVAEGILHLSGIVKNVGVVFHPPEVGEVLLRVLIQVEEVLC